MMRTFASGATRDSDEGKPDYDGYLSPLVLRRFADYMRQHQVCADGTRRGSDNWQKGIPRDAYLKSAWRHFMDWWALSRGVKLDGATTIEDALCALLFNAQGYLHEHLKASVDASPQITRTADAASYANARSLNDLTADAS